jgi:hypothetical protein
MFFIQNEETASGALSASFKSVKEEGFPRKPDVGPVDLNLQVHICLLREYWYNLTFYFILR